VSKGECHVRGPRPSAQHIERGTPLRHRSITLILGGGWWALTDLTEDSHTSSAQFPVHGTSVVIDSGSIDVEIHSGDVSQITVTRKIKRTVFGSEPRGDWGVLGDQPRLQLGEGSGRIAA
jgi:hypothetical protein